MVVLHSVTSKDQFHCCFESRSMKDTVTVYTKRIISNKPDGWKMAKTDSCTQRNQFIQFTLSGFYKDNRKSFLEQEGGAQWTLGKFSS